MKNLRQKLLNTMLAIFIIPEGYIIAWVIELFLNSGYEMGDLMIHAISIMIMSVFFITTLGINFTTKNPLNSRKIILKVIALNGIIQFLLWIFLYSKKEI